MFLHNLRDLCTRDVVTVSADQTLIEAAKLMRDEHVGDVVVIRDDDNLRKPIGILTDRDIVIGSVASLTGSNQLLDRSIDEVMTPNPVCVEEDEGIQGAIRKMRQYGVTRLPVVNQSGELIGILSYKRLLTLLNEEVTQLIEISEHQKDGGRLKTIPALDEMVDQHMQ